MNKLKYEILTFLWRREQKYVNKMLTRELLESEITDLRFEKEIKYMRDKNKIMFMPYDFIEKYQKLDIKVYYDSKKKLKYVLYDNKRLYFPLNDANDIKQTFAQLLMEQDEESPHRYFSNEYMFEKDAIFIDVGGAEGIISLSVVEKAKKIYLIECSEEWIEALKATFEPWKEKVCIIKKYAGNVCDKTHITLDKILLKEKDSKLFIKMDVEGMEREVLEGAINLLTTSQVKCVCTTYHQQNAAAMLKKFFVDLGYKFQFSKNYILFCYGHLTLLNGKYKRIRKPYFRKGLIRAKNYF